MRRVLTLKAVVEFLDTRLNLMVLPLLGLTIGCPSSAVESPSRLSDLDSIRCMRYNRLV